MNIITVSDLIKALSNCDPDMPVNIFCEDETYWIRDIDDSMDHRIDINCEEL
jgi:hypothetical protein